MKRRAREREARRGRGVDRSEEGKDRLFRNRNVEMADEVAMIS